MTCNTCGHVVSYTAMPGSDDDEKRAEAQHRMLAHSEACALSQLRVCLHSGDITDVGVPGYGMCARCKKPVHLFKPKPEEEAVQ